MFIDRNWCHTNYSCVPIINVASLDSHCVYSFVQSDALMSLNDIFAAALGSFVILRQCYLRL